MKNKKALLIDLDNTIYPAASIGEKLFQKLYSILANDPSYTGSMDAIKEAILRKPFHHVAAKFNLNENLYQKCLSHLVELTYNEEMYPFEDYSIIENLHQTKFLITSGFTKLQESKLEQLGIRSHFQEVYIMDFTKTENTKVFAFQDIIQKYNYTKEDVLVIGDDPESEIKAGLELGLDCVLYDSLRLFEHHQDLKRITHFSELADLLA